jgi:SAM-dependent methyltransferase
MQTASNFSATNGDAYERQMGRWSRLLARHFLEFAGAKDGERVLEVGSGTGSLTFALAEACPAATLSALDFSPAYVAFAQSRNRHRHIEFRVGDAGALPYADLSFDRVLSMLMLQFVPQAERAIAEMARVARPGATVAAAVWDGRGGFVANRIFWDTAAVLSPRAKELRARAFTRPMSRPGELAAAWSAVGLQSVTQAELSIRMTFSSFDDFWSPYLGAQGPIADYVLGLAEAERAQLKEQVRQAYMDGEADGPRSYKATAWAVKGTKG